MSDADVGIDKTTENPVYQWWYFRYILANQDIQKIFEQSTFSPVKEMQSLSLIMESILIYPPFPLTETEG